MRLSSADRSARARRGGFTLVELLVVIAIIAILVALTSLGIPMVLKKGYQTTSLNNLRQWYQAYTVSVSEHEGEMPTPGGDAADPRDTSAWYNRLPAAMHGERTFMQFMGASDRPQLGTRSIWINPAVPRSEAKQGFTFCYGYNFNLRATGDDGTEVGLRDVVLQNKRLTILLSEIAEASGVLRPTTIRAFFNTKSRDGKASTGDAQDDASATANILFCDGHVDAVKRSAFDSSDAKGGFDYTRTNVSWLYQPPQQ